MALTRTWPRWDLDLGFSASRAMRNKFLLCRSYSVCDFFFLFNISLNGLRQSLLDCLVSVWFYDQIAFHCMGTVFRLSIHQLMGTWIISTSWLSWIMLLSRQVDSHWQWGTTTTATAQPPLASVLQSWGSGFPSTPGFPSSRACVQSFGSPGASLGPCWGRMTELQLALLLWRHLAELNKNPVEGFSEGLIDDNDLYQWEVLIIALPDILYKGGIFKAHLTFPKDYCLWPSKMKFITEI